MAPEEAGRRTDRPKSAHVPRRFRKGECVRKRDDDDAGYERDAEDPAVEAPRRPFVEDARVDRRPGDRRRDRLGLTQAVSRQGVFEPDDPRDERASDRWAGLEPEVRERVFVKEVARLAHVLVDLDRSHWNLREYLITQPHPESGVCE